MASEAEVNMALYVNLSAKEENVLKAVESDVTSLAFKKGITRRLVWASRSSMDGRFIQLCVYNNSQPRVLLELEDGEFSSLSGEELIMRIQNSNI
ncbi:MAG: hypothetical protein IT313_08025 [Anaerolineales bacterium]|nr:hypothetical protein [Anaerolineales bacterium]